MDEVTHKAIENMVEATFDWEKVGKGNDARGLKHRRIKVTSIERVNIPKARRSYHCFKTTLAKRTSKRLNVLGVPVKKILYLPSRICRFKRNERDLNLNEIFLFHGTTRTSAKQIVKNGFDIGSTDSNSMFGSGIYFAEQFTKADQYADSRRKRAPWGEELTVLLCKVLMGHPYIVGKKGAKKWKRAPCIKCDEACEHTSLYRYDSVLGSGPTMMFKEFVVYNKSQCYPEFIIKYKRMKSRNPVRKNK